MNTVIDINHLDVVFADNAATTQALELLDQGLDRQAVMEQSGAIVGVQDASLQVAEGEICVLMGLSGSGKSSLLRAVNGLNPISRGSLAIRDGEQMVDIAQCNDKLLRHLRTERVSMVFQTFALMPWLSVLENVAFGLEVKGVDKRTRQRRAMEKLEMVGLSQWADLLPAELSGGMQQRVGLARAFAMDSDILLMDEPFSALDPLIRSQLQDELIELQKNLNKTILFVSHDLDEALKIGSHIAIMESARIIQHGTPESIVLNPQNDYVEAFVAHTNPLNVLRGTTLMTPLDKLTRDGQRCYLDNQRSHWITLAQGQVDSAGVDAQAHPVVQWPAHPAKRGQYVLADATISMRDAIQLSYTSRLPVLLQRDGQFVGVLQDTNFYYALLGRHFTADD